MAKSAVKFASVVAIAAIIVSLLGTIAMAETSAVARSEKWRCEKLLCSQYDKNYRRTGRVVVYGTVIHVTSRSTYWLRSDFNSSVARVNYLRSQFTYLRTD